MSEPVKETLGFQTEVSQLLQLMIHSLYSNKEIFLRELISNASDANDKLRFEALNKAELFEDNEELAIEIGFDADAKTVSIKDYGIGMNREDVINNLGTIAKSGTAEFLQNLTGDQQKDSQLIGQFGVGFYSAFVVADKVEVRTRKAGEPSDAAVMWTSEAKGDYTLESIVKEDRGTEITLFLTEECVEFSDSFRLKNIIQKYSDHIAFPIKMLADAPVEPESDSKEDTSEEAATEAEAKTPELEVINKATALWTRSKSDINDEEYQSFYKHISHDYDDPITWSHNKVEGNLEYTSLLYVPKRAPFDLYNREAPRGLKLFVQRVFIMDEAENFMPLYLRFMKGVIDSKDLPLNVSRELLQNNKAVESIKGALVKRTLDMLTKLAKNKPEDYTVFWKEFGQVLKEGPAEDFSNKEKIASLLRFSSTHHMNSDVSQEHNVGFDEYLERAVEGQDKIYYITAESYQAAINSPHLEIFKKKNIEVLILCDRIDEWMTSYLQDYTGKKLQHVAKGDLDLGSDDAEETKKDQAELESVSKDFLERLKGVLDSKVSDVKVTQRLTESPCCLVMNDHDMGAQMREIMKAAGQAAPEVKPSMEVNVNHPLVEKLKDEIQEDRFTDLALVLFEQATLAEGGQLGDPGAYVKRINSLLLELTN